MKSVLIALVCLAVSFPAFAGGPYSKKKIIVLKGPPGPPGESIVGPQGPVGVAGNPGENADVNAVKARVGADIRWQDWERFYLGSGYRYDTIHGGHTVDMAVLGIKIGDSHETKELKKLRKELDLLKASLAAGGTPPVKAVIRGQP